MALIKRMRGYLGARKTSKVDAKIAFVQEVDFRHKILAFVMTGMSRPILGNRRNAGMRGITKVNCQPCLLIFHVQSARLLICCPKLVILPFGAHNQGEEEEER